MSVSSLQSSKPAKHSLLEYFSDLTDPRQSAGSSDANDVLLRYYVPRHDTLTDGINAIDPALFERYFLRLGGGPAPGLPGHHRHRWPVHAAKPARICNRE